MPENGSVEPINSVLIAEAFPFLANFGQISYCVTDELKNLFIKVYCAATQFFSSSSVNSTAVLNLGFVDSGPTLCSCNCVNSSAQCSSNTAALETSSSDFKYQTNPFLHLKLDCSHLQLLHSNTNTIRYRNNTTIVKKVLSVKSIALIMKECRNVVD